MEDLTQVFVLCQQTFNTEVTPPVGFALVILERRFAMTSNHYSPNFILPNARIISTFFFLNKNYYIIAYFSLGQLPLV
jgi:hypothetical protein